MASVISYGSQAKIPLDPFSSVITVAGINGAGAGLATAQVNISPANPSSFSSRVEVNGSFSVTALANSQFLVIIRRAGVDIYQSFYHFTTTTDIQLNVQWVDGPYLGIHNYELVIQNDSNLPINLFGPISFTATAIGGEGVI